MSHEFRGGKYNRNYNEGLFNQTFSVKVIPYNFIWDFISFSTRFLYWFQVNFEGTLIFLSYDLYNYKAISLADLKSEQPSGN